MTTLQITSKIQVDIEDLLDRLVQLKTPELEGVLSKTSALLAQRKAASLSTSESELLLQINQGLSTEVQSRYDELSAKMHSETISSAEHDELVELVDHFFETTPNHYIFCTRNRPQLVSLVRGYCA